MKTLCPFFLCTSEYNFVIRSQGECRETLNWLASHSFNSGNVVSSTQWKWLIQFTKSLSKYRCNKTLAFKYKFPGYKITSLKKCLLTKNCGCCSCSQKISCCTGVVSTCRLHFRNVQVLFITEISFITRTPRNCRSWVSFHCTFK